MDIVELLDVADDFCRGNYSFGDYVSVCISAVDDGGGWSYIIMPFNRVLSNCDRDGVSKKEFIDAIGDSVELFDCVMNNFPNCLDWWYSAFGTFYDECRRCVLASDDCVVVLKWLNVCVPYDEVYGVRGVKRTTLDVEVYKHVLGMGLVERCVGDKLPKVIWVDCLFWYLLNMVGDWHRMVQLRCELIYYGLLDDWVEYLNYGVRLESLGVGDILGAMELFFDGLPGSISWEYYYSF